MIGAVYSVVGIGYSVIYRASGLMSLCQGDMLMFGAFLGLFFNKSLGLPFPIALLFTTVLMFLLGMGIQKFLVIPLLKKASGFASVILCTLALSYVLQNTALIGWGARMFQFPSIFKTNSINIFGIGVAPENALVLGAAILVMIILHLFMSVTVQSFMRVPLSVKPKETDMKSYPLAQRPVCGWSNLNTNSLKKQVFGLSLEKAEWHHRHKKHADNLEQSTVFFLLAVQ